MTGGWPQDTETEANEGQGQWADRERHCRLDEGKRRSHLCPSCRWRSGGNCTARRSTGRSHARSSPRSPRPRRRSCPADPLSSSQIASAKVHRGGGYSNCLFTTACAHMRAQRSHGRIITDCALHIWQRYMGLSFRKCYSCYSNKMYCCTQFAWVEHKQTHKPHFICRKA